MSYTVMESVIRFILEVFPRKWAATFLLKLENVFQEWVVFFCPTGRRKD